MDKKIYLSEELDRKLIPLIAEYIPYNIRFDSENTEFNELTGVRMGKYGIYLGNELLEFYDFDKVTLYLKNINNLKNDMVVIKKLLEDVYKYEIKGNISEITIKEPTETSLKIINQNNKYILIDWSYINIINKIFIGFDQTISESILSLSEAMNIVTKILLENHYNTNGIDEFINVKYID
mgnify:CR=1 FL=1